MTCMSESTNRRPSFIGILPGDDGDDRWPRTGRGRTMILPRRGVKRGPDCHRACPGPRERSTPSRRRSVMTSEHRYAFHLRPGMRRGLRTEVPLPTRLVSNEEFPPLPQTAQQKAVEHRILAEAGRLAPRLGLGRREFLTTSGGMAVSLLAMNAVFGRFFDVLPAEAADPAAAQERQGPPFFIFDVQVHYVGSAYDPRNEEAGRKGAVSKPALLGLRNRPRKLNPKLESDRGTLADLSWENFVKEVFFDSETAIA